MILGRSLEGKGKYDKECELVYDLCKMDANEDSATGVMVIVFNGKKGHGFSAIMTPHMSERVPKVIRAVADEMDRRRNLAKEN